MNIKVIGAGGIAMHLLPLLCHFLAYQNGKSAISIFDGDRFEAKNRERQAFKWQGNKAVVTVEMMEQWFPPGDYPHLSLEAKDWFVTMDTVFLAVQEGDLVFVAVDNHQTRKLLSNHLQTLQDATIISGGNELWDGNVQIFRRHGGTNLDCPLDAYHPEIKTPQDKNPADMSCEERSRNGSPQLICTNNAIATFMFSSFCLLHMGEKIPYNEIYINLRTGMARACRRDPDGI